MRGAWPSRCRPVTAHYRIKKCGPVSRVLSIACGGLKDYADLEFPRTQTKSALSGEEGLMPRGKPRVKNELMREHQVFCFTENRQV